MIPGRRRGRARDPIAEIASTGQRAGSGPLSLRYAVRLLLRSPAHSITALLALALGLGATVAIFSAAWAVLFRPLPIPDPSRVVIPVGGNAARGIDRGSVPYADYADWRELDEFDSVAVYQPTEVDVSGEPAPERARAAVVSEATSTC